MFRAVGAGWTIWQRLQIVGESGQDEGFVHGINQAVTTDYFRTLGIPVRAGRLFTASDNEHSPKVAIVNQAFVSARFGAGNPLGRRVIVEGDHEPREIVGVVGDVKVEIPTAPPPPQLYLPQAQNPAPILAIFVRSRQEDPLLLSNAVQRRILDVDRDIPAYQFRTADQVLAATLAGRPIFDRAHVRFRGSRGVPRRHRIVRCLSLYGCPPHARVRRPIGAGGSWGAGHRGILRQGLTMVIAG